MPHRAALALVLALIAGAAAQAQPPADPMATAECAKARQELELALAATLPRDRLDAARHRAARTCLGKEPAPPDPRSGRFVPPPVAVAPIPVPAATPAVPPLPTLPPVTTPRAPVVTSCDASGCWDNEGKRHNLQGPVLVGPRGLCTLQGGLLNCP